MNELPSMSTGSYTSSTLTGNQLFMPEQYKQVRNDFMQEALKAQSSIAPIKAEKAMASARIVKVFIADPNENIPLDKRVIYSGQEQLTDLTDQELFFDVPISELLSKHNELRKTTLDKKQSDKFGRDVFLEPARIRDLKMVVVSVAEF
jgi:hypothetical protein